MKLSLFTKTPRTLARRDELAALARDFTSMAEQLKKLPDAQRQLLINVSHEPRSPLALMRLESAISLPQETVNLSELCAAVTRDA